MKANYDLLRLYSLSVRGKGYFKSKHSGVIRYKNICDLQLFKTLENMDRVIRYYDYPFDLEFEYDGSIIEFTPTVLVLYNNGTKEVLYLSPTVNEEDEARLLRLKRLKEYCRQKGYICSVIS